MSITEPQERLELPGSLVAQLRDYRRRVWTIKAVEAMCAAAFGVLIAYLVLFALDRVWDTPAWARLLLFLVTAMAAARVPFALYRWVWRHRRPEQLAQLLGRSYPHVGDQLLGVIELVRDESEQARSRALCAAAIRQVAEETGQRDLRGAVPNPRHRLWIGLAIVPIVATLTLFTFSAPAASNTWARLLAPWKEIPRYTFAQVEPLPDRLVIPHGEPVELSIPLIEQTVWKPEHGTLQIGAQAPIVAALQDSRYVFPMPPQIDAQPLSLRIGDALQRVRLEPTTRPELASIVAEVQLPDYLGLPEPQNKDVRGGTISLVKGSQARFLATATRNLAGAEVDGQAQPIQSATISSPRTPIDDAHTLVFNWRDTLGLTGSKPFELNINAVDDEAPSVVCEGLPRRAVVLDSEQLQFNIRARDDFGIKSVGLEWEGIDGLTGSTAAAGERLLSAGGNDKTTLEVSGTFSAKSLGIEPQPIVVRIYAEDYFPDRERVYSPPYTLFVLDPEQHAIWLTEQLSKWHRRSLEVRDRELQLYETNKELRALTLEELDRPENRRRIENQAAAERANSRRLSSLVTMGEDLVQQAMRNPEFGVGHLETWAEMLQILKDIAANRMPTVADLLDQGAKAPSQSAKPSGPMAGQAQAVPSGAASDEDSDNDDRRPPAPSIVDQESSQQPPGEDGDDAEPPPAGGGSRLGLPETTLAGPPGSGDAPSPAQQNLDDAIQAQQDLLAEFEKVADEMNRILANLEGSTLVKRLKAASRLQYRLAGHIGDFLDNAFGRQPEAGDDETAAVLEEVAEQEVQSSQNVSTIMDDMESYFERRRFLRFKTVLDEMRELDVVGGLRQIGQDVKQEVGLSIAQAEFWSDTLDRWAEDLVDPTSGGT